MSDNLNALILSLTPEDGSSIGNGAMMARLRDYQPDLTEEAYNEAKDALIEEGVLGRGRGQGGSIYRADVAELRLSAPVATEPKAPASNAPRKKAARKSNEPTEVLSYRHGETRVNNPEVGMVHADTDPDGEKNRWFYDPHLDPVLNFDSARGAIETLIDNALGSDDPERMKDALHELKRLQAPYLNWTGKAEKTSFDVDTVSLHVHERVDPATILANAAKRLKGKDASAQWRQADLFAAPFENLPLRQALDFYHHEKG
jgi:adenine-specific DNA-methyltransferase